MNGTLKYGLLIGLLIVTIIILVLIQVLYINSKVKELRDVRNQLGPHSRRLGIDHQINELKNRQTPLWVSGFCIYMFIAFGIHAFIDTE